MPSLTLPFFVNILRARYLGHSLAYPTVALGFLGALVLWAEHRKISGPQWGGDIEDELIKNLAEDMDSNFTWKDRVTWLCFASGAILLLILKTARRRLISKERPCRIRWRIERVLTLRQREGQP